LKLIAQKKRMKKEKGPNWEKTITADLNPTATP
jgi:hypothetical protein